ncbi:hypothetical protein H4582DRAFT_1323978 [Lactarius indigo]|nr:hypothetical protein H4582DRAFT_1323978 [Lactarius indigo]
MCASYLLSFPAFRREQQGGRGNRARREGEGQGDSHIPFCPVAPKWDMNTVRPDTPGHMLSVAPSPKIPVVVALTNVGSCHFVASSSRERYRRVLPVRGWMEGAMSEKKVMVMYEKSHSRTGGWERCCMMLDGVGQKQGQNSPRFSHTRRGP